MTTPLGAHPDDNLAAWASASTSVDAQTGGPGQAGGPTEIRGEGANHGLTRFTITGSPVPGLDGEYYKSGPVDEKLDQLAAERDDYAARLKATDKATTEQLRQVEAERDRLINAVQAAWPILMKLWQSFWTASGLETVLATPGTVEQCGHCHDDPPRGHRCPRCGATPRGTADGD